MFTNKNAQLDEKEIGRSKKFMVLANDDIEIAQQMEKNYKLNKQLHKKSEEEIKIEKARKHWKFIKNQIKVIRLISNLGSDIVLAMINAKKIN